MSEPPASDAKWLKLVAGLPATVDLETSARECGALKRRRNIKDADSLLRVVMANAVGHLSLRGTAAWATMQGLKLSNPAVLKRLKGSADWLGHLLAEALASRMPVEQTPAGVQAGVGYRVRLIDATTISAPGSHGTDWRLHVAYDLEEMQTSAVELTGGSGSESLTRFNFQPGDLAIADRGYAKALDLAEVEARGADYIVRTGWNATRLRTESGGDFDLLGAARDMPEHTAREFQLTIALDRGEKQLMPVRLIAWRKSEAEAEASIRRARKESRRHGKALQPETLEAAKYVFLLTSLPPDEIPAEEVLALYRLRWQIELLFKRLKSLLRIDELPNKHPEAARCWILANLLAALLTEDQARLLLDSPPSAPRSARRRPLAVARPAPRA